MRDRKRRRYVLADEWQRTAAMALVVAAIAGVHAGAAKPRWDTGDLLVGLYFAVLSLLLWGRAAQVRRGPTRSHPATARMISLPAWASAQHLC